MIRIDHQGYVHEDRGIVPHIHVTLSADRKSVERWSTQIPEPEYVDIRHDRMAIETVLPGDLARVNAAGADFSRGNFEIVREMSS